MNACKLLQISNNNTGIYRCMLVQVRSIGKKIFKNVNKKNVYYFTILSPPSGSIVDVLSSVPNLIY